MNVRPWDDPRPAGCNHRGVHDPAEIRLRSLARLASLSFPRPPELFPLLDAHLQPRGPEEILRRVGAVSAVVSVAFGCPRADAHQWLLDEALSGDLSPSERHFLGEDPPGAPDAFQIPESLFALAWSIGLIDGADDFISFVPDNLIEAVPHPPPRQTSIAAVRERVQPVDPGRTVAALDLAYCLHWGVVDHGLRGDDLPGAPHPRVVVERRRALEWILGDEPWDDVQMDT